LKKTGKKTEPKPSQLEKPSQTEKTEPKPRKPEKPSQIGLNWFLP
jgi:hypothetical protein